MRRPLVLLGVGLVAICLIFACTGPTRVARMPRADEATLRVLTWNVNYGLAGDPAVATAIRACSADVVVLQETNAAYEQDLRAALGDLYPNMIFVDRPAAGGMAVLARDPILQQEVLEPPAEGWFPALRVVVATRLGDVQLLDVHLHPQISDSGSVISGYLSTGGHRLAEIDQHVRTLAPDLPTLALGDFNESGGSAMQRLEAAGYHSALNDFDPGRHTWHWSTSVGTISFQFDHVAHDARLTPIDVHVIETGRSDHFPVLATFVRPA